MEKYELFIKLINEASKKGYEWKFFWNEYYDLDCEEYLWELTSIQKWIRKTHNIHIEVFFSLLSRAWEVNNYFTDIKNAEKIELEYLEEKSFKTYEEALEKGIEEAIKLIV